MIFIINGKRAVIKKGSSIELTFENSFFTGADGYSFNIVFPLDCIENREIFGHIERFDANPDDIDTFPCEMQSGPIVLTGAIKIISITESEVNAQFLQGRSIANASKIWDSKYINELELGPTPGATPTPEEARFQHTAAPDETDFVALPWVVAETGVEQQPYKTYLYEDRPNSEKKLWHAEWPLIHLSEGTAWEKEPRRLSWQIYLLPLIKKICTAVGYSCDLSRLEKERKYKALLVCNSLPPEWGDPNISHVLPHWTVNEFFEKLELFLGGEFNIDHASRMVEFSFHDSLASSAGTTTLEKIIDEHSIEISEEEQSTSIFQKNIRYKECDHQMQPFYSCPNVTGSSSPLPKVKYGTMDALWDAQKGGALTSSTKDSENLFPSIFYNGYEWFAYRAIYRAIDFMSNPKKILVFRDLTSVNEFGPLINDPDSDEFEEIEFVPVCVDYTRGLNRRMFLPLNTETSGDKEEGITDSEDEESVKLETVPFKTKAEIMIKAASEGTLSTPEYYDRIFIGFWSTVYTECDSPDAFPYVNQWTPDWREQEPKYCYSGWSLSLNASPDAVRHSVSDRKIKKGIKYTFKFLSDSIPDPRSVFLIKGREYICEKLSVTVSEHGISQLMKGEFYLKA